MLTLDPRIHAAVIFDCDGTLVDTMPLHFEAWRRALMEVHAPFAFTWELLNRRAGMAIERIVEELNDEFGCHLLPDRVAELQRAAYLASATRVDPIAHVVAFVQSLEGQLPMAVASGSDRRAVDAALQSINLLGSFQTIVTPIEVTEGKPAPEMFLLAASRLGVPPVRCLVIEDGDLGLEAARRAGMDAYRVDREGAVNWVPCPRTG